MRFSIKYYLHFYGLFRKIEIWRQAHFTNFRPLCFRSSHLEFFHKKIKHSLETYRCSEQCGELIWFHLTDITKFLKILDISKSVLIPWVHVHHHISATNCKCYKQEIFIKVPDVSCPKIASFYRFWLKDFEKLLSTTKFWTCLELTGKHLYPDLFLNKVAPWNSATIIKWDSSAGTSLWNLLSFKERLAKHLWEDVTVFFSHVSLFTMWRIAT